MTPEEVGLEPPYRGRLIGKRITTRISPDSGVVRQPVEITMTADAPGAEIHYSLDGLEPTRHSPLYLGPFPLAQSATVRAQAFAAGATDLTGAVAVFLAPPQPIREDFETCQVGDRAPRAETIEENDRFTARVSDERAASGKHSLKFIDGPGQKGAFNPHVFYRVGFDEGRLVGCFALFADAATTFSYQWRQYDVPVADRGGAYKRGPVLQLSPGGKVSVGSQESLTIPVEQWVKFEFHCVLGEQATGTFDVKVFVPDAKEPKVFRNLKCEAGFERLDWVGFVANGEEACVFYVDEVEVKEADR